METASGTFEVLSGDEATLHEADGEARLTRVDGRQRFTGDIVGDGSVAWLMCYREGDGARFVGLQRIEGSLGGRTGSVVIESVGDHDGAASSGSWRVIPGTGTGELTGLTGEGEFRAPGGRTVEYRLDYELG